MPNWHGRGLNENRNNLAQIVQVLDRVSANYLLDLSGVALLPGGMLSIKRGDSCSLKRVIERMEKL
jgi:hypothetical protein